MRSKSNTLSFSVCPCKEERKRMKKEDKNEDKKRKREDENWLMETILSIMLQELLDARYDTNFNSVNVYDLNQVYGCLYE